MRERKRALRSVKAFILALVLDFTPSIIHPLLWVLITLPVLAFLKELSGFEVLPDTYLPRHSRGSRPDPAHRSFTWNTAPPRHIASITHSRFQKHMHSRSHVGMRDLGRRGSGENIARQEPAHFRSPVSVKNSK
ncbi:hypothetical protein WG66_009497 [Moniliophthora roreri]|nr:hypothetical protein WG66_009497 [Moniliophthora roreri]